MSEMERRWRSSKYLKVYHETSLRLKAAEEDWLEVGCHVRKIERFTMRFRED